MSVIRNKSVVRSSVIPSAKYCCSGSLLKLVKGSTAIDRRGAMRDWEIDAVTAAGSTNAGEDLIADQAHQAKAAMTTTAAAAPAGVNARIGRRRAAIGMPGAGNSATASLGSA